jgi:hypothetical protein
MTLAESVCERCKVSKVREHQMWAMLLVAGIAGVSVNAPVTAAEGGDDSCVGIEAHRRSIDEPPVWTSSVDGATIYNVFTPVQPDGGGVWQGFREYAGLCGTIKEILDCLSDGDPAETCLPE